MESVNISKKKYSELTELEITKSISNSEGRILVANLRNKIKVFKSLYRLNDDIYAEKLKTVALLDYYRDILPTSFVIPDSLCSVQGQIVGFSEDIIQGDVLSTVLSSHRVDLETQIHYLKEVGRLLEQLDSIRNKTELDTIFINDLHSANFMIERSTGDLKTVDIDSVKIGDNKPFPSKYLSPKALFNKVEHRYHVYQKTEEEKVSDTPKYDYKALFGYIDPDKNSDLYCYIIMILNFLLGDNINKYSIEDYFDYIYYLDKIGIDHNLIDAFCRIVNTCDNDIQIDALDTLTYEQVAKAHKNVYTTVKGK